MSRPLVVLFAKRPEPGRVKTRLCPPLTPDEAASLYGAMLDDVFDRFGRHRGGAALGVAYDPPESRPWFEERSPRDAKLFLQRGATLAERMSHLFSDAFWEGWGPVAIVGTDLPTLPAEHVESLISLLSGEAPPDGVLGLDRDGGYWGLSLRSPQPALFDSLATSTGSVALDTLTRAEAAGLRLARAATWADVDTIDDVAALARQAQDPDVAVSIPRTARQLARLGFLHRES